MASDGNCLFRSISHQLHRDYGNSHDKIRQEICDYLEKNEDDFSVYLLLDDEDGADVCDFEEYVSQMRKDGEWGGDVEIVCAAKLYKRTVTIFSNIGAYNIDIGDEKTSGPDILLSYHDNQHYNSIHDSSIDYSPDNTKKKDVSGTSNKENRLSTEKQPSGELETDSSKIDVKSLRQDQKDDIMPTTQTIQKRNEVCSCGSGLRYKKCCLAKEKHRIRLQKFREKQGLNHLEKNDCKEPTTNRLELEGGFTVLNI
mmetsp:Transcript_14504/g.17642  ORF Transcript_14504/g.17642 Transcript_14504/m.17642 type:complete len:255 (-) Transcript_14504:28-792(-)